MVLYIHNFGGKYKRGETFKLEVFRNFGNFRAALGLDVV